MDWRTERIDNRQADDTSSPQHESDFLMRVKTRPFYPCPVSTSCQVVNILYDRYRRFVLRTFGNEPTGLTFSDPNAAVNCRSTWINESGQAPTFKIVEVQLREARPRPLIIQLPYEYEYEQ